jgi:hypothetical protein
MVRKCREMMIKFAPWATKQGAFLRPRSALRADDQFLAAGVSNSWPVTPWEVQAQRIAQARASIIVLDQLLELFADGENWIQGDLERLGRYCLFGGLQHIRRTHRGLRDRVGVYLSRAIASCDERQTIIDFNDTRQSYAEIRAVILRARELAQRVIDDYAG